nr:hypothetical protein Iba_chr05cCG0200 [Ipomoea batatas]
MFAHPKFTNNQNSTAKFLNSPTCFLNLSSRQANWNQDTFLSSLICIRYVKPSHGALCWTAVTGLAPPEIKLAKPGPSNIRHKIGPRHIITWPPLDDQEINQGLHVLLTHHSFYLHYQLHCVPQRISGQFTRRCYGGNVSYCIAVIPGRYRGSQPSSPGAQVNDAKGEHLVIRVFHLIFLVRKGSRGDYICSSRFEFPISQIMGEMLVECNLPNGVESDSLVVCNASSSCFDGDHDDIPDGCNPSAGGGGTSTDANADDSSIPAIFSNVLLIIPPPVLLLPISAITSPNSTTVSAIFLKTEVTFFKDSLDNSAWTFSSILSCTRSSSRSNRGITFPLPNCPDFASDFILSLTFSSVHDVTAGDILYLNLAGGDLHSAVLTNEGGEERNLAGLSELVASRPVPEQRSSRRSPNLHRRSAASRGEEGCGEQI